jgi:hypothetical protein
MVITTIVGGEGEGGGQYVFSELVCTDGLLLNYLLDLRNPYPPDRRENPITNP